MNVALAYDPVLDAYDFGPEHPLRPQRVSLAIALMESYGLIAEGALEPLPLRPASREELELVHAPEYIDAVVRASGSSVFHPPANGIGPGDTPAFQGMHDAAARIAGATLLAVESVTSGRYRRAFSPAGGLHHAHRDHASGFCVYNDTAVAIAAALLRQPGLRIAYIDIDAHHGDGVQAAFYEEPRVLTVSVHEDGRYLFPGTGSTSERGFGEGAGTSVNVPLPPLANDECYREAFDEVVAPTVRQFDPDLIVAQCGADAHWSDPLTSMGLTLGGYSMLYERLLALTDQTCGRIVACGGGGYSWLHVVPRAWTMLAGVLTGTELPDAIPPEWATLARSFGDDPPTSLTYDPGSSAVQRTAYASLAATHRVIERLRASAR